MSSFNVLSSVAMRAFSDLKSLALLPEKEGVLSTARGQINEIVEELNLLDDLRHSARGIIELYNQVPALEAVDLEVTFFFNEDYGRPYREHNLNLSNVQLRDGTIADDSDLEQFSEDLKQAITQGCHDEDAPGFQSFKGGSPLSLFSDDLPCLFAAGDKDGSDRPNLPVTVHTSREAIMEALEDGDVDGVAANLFPERWAPLAESFGLPTYRETGFYALIRPRR